jgi:hypothetical protein
LITDEETGELSTENEESVLNISSASNDTAMVPVDDKPKKRKRKSYYIPKFAFPRILKRDIRRDYAIMLTNVLNSADENLMSKFFNRYSMNSCQYVDCFPDEYLNNRPFVRIAKGIDAIVFRLLQDFSSIPDFVIRLLNTRIKQSHDVPGSQIVCNVEFSGTKMFHYMRPDLISSIEEMRLAEEKKGEKKNRKLKSLPAGGADLETKDGVLPPQSMDFPTLNNSSSSSSPYLSPADSSADLSESQNLFKKPNVKVLYQHFQELIKARGGDISEMKLSNENIDLASLKEQQNAAELMNLYASLIQEQQQVIPHNEEKIDLINAFTSLPADVSPDMAPAGYFNNIPLANPIMNPHLLVKNDKPLLSKPISIKFAGVITLSLNEDHCLYQLEVKSSIYDTKFVLPAPEPSNSSVGQLKS